jgi:hypothetical protein
MDSMKNPALLGVRFALASFLLVLTLSAAAQLPDAQPPGTPTANTAQTLIGQLDHPDFAVRSAASRQLNNLPGDALPVVEAAIRDDDALSPESRLRLQTAVKFLKPRNFFEAREVRRDNWERKMLHDAYHQCGKTDPAYDKAVDEAIDGFRSLRYEPKMNDRDPERAKVVAAFKDAVAKGCDDPYVQILCCASAGSQGLRSLPPAMRSPQHLFEEFLDSKYHPAVKLLVIHRFLPCIRFDRRKMMKALPDLVDGVCADPQVPETEVWVLMAQLASEFNNFSSKPYVFDPIAAEYLKVRPNNAEAATFKGFFEYLVAFRERGRGAKIDPKDQQAYQEWLAKAETSLQAAWEMDKTDARAATQMIRLKHAQGQGDAASREAVDLWFKRAVEANPDQGDAYMAKLNYLLFVAGHDEVIAFGRECLTTQNWRAGVPFALAIAHERYSVGGARQYFADPENWRDMEEVYEGCFLNYPNDVAHLNHFVYLALVTNHYAAATRNIEILGDKSDWFYAPEQHMWGDAKYRREHPERIRAATRPGTTRPATTRPATTRPAASRPRI